MNTKTPMSGRKVLTICAGILCSVTLLLVSVLTVNELGKTKINVLDGNTAFSFRTESTQMDDILTEATVRGVSPLAKEDFAEYDMATGDLTISRRISVAITDGNNTLYTDAFSSSDVGTILRENGVHLEDDGYAEPKTSAYVENGSTIRVARLLLDQSAYENQNRDQKYLSGGMPRRNMIFNHASGVYNVILRVNNTSSFLEVEPGATVAGVLRDYNVELQSGDQVDVSNSDIVYDGMNILVKKAIPLTVTADGISTSMKMYGGTVQEALDRAMVKLGRDDEVSADLNEEVKENMEIVVDRVTYSDRTETEELAYETEIIEDGSMFVGQRRVDRPGSLGTQTVIYRDRYVNGELESTEEISHNVVVDPTTELIYVGTRSKRAVKSVGGPGTSTDCNGNSFSYSTVYTGSGTAYYGGGTTSIGLKAQVGVVAVDPTIIPYGTEMYIESCDGQIVYGYCIAGDTGGFAVSGAAIADLYYDTYEDCVRFGRRDVNIYILD